MLKLEEKEYDLNFLCSFTFDFQMLKDILIKLVKSNQEMKAKINKLEEDNKEKGKRLSEIEDQLNILYIPEHNSESEDKEDNSKDENVEKKDTEEKKDLIMETKDNIVKPIIKKEAKVEKANNENNDSNDYNNDNSKINTNDDNSKINNNNDSSMINNNNSSKINNNNDSIKNNNNIKDISKRNTMNYLSSFKNFNQRNSIVQQYSQVSHDTIKSILKLIRENAEKMNKLEKNLTKKLNETITDFDKSFNELNDENEKEHKNINKKIKELNERFYDFNDKMDGIIIKTAPLDTLKIFQDNGNSDIDATKVMVKMLEEKVTKRIEIIEKTKKEENAEDQKLKEKIKELEDLINKINNELMKQKDENKNIENNNIQDNNEEIQKIKDLIDKKYDDVLKVIDELSTKIKNGDLLENKLQELINKMKSEKDNKQNNDEQIEKNKIIGLEINKEIKNNISELKERINELNNKIDDIDNNYKNLLNESGKDIDTIKTKLNEVDSILENKISKNGWKALLNKINEHEDMIKFLQDSVAEFKQSIKKFMENNSYFGKRLEDLTHEIMQKKGKENKQTSSKSIDVNKSFDENKYKEVLKIMNKNIEDLIKSKNTLLDNIKEINDNLQLLETKEKVNRLEDDITTRITDLINTFSKKFIDKLELNKILRNIDIKIKALDTPQKDSENWILAKQPVGCFNCASCESNIKNANASSDYIPWNKYPQAERQYHLGQGFSHLLRKIGNDYFILNERKELNTDLEIGNIKNFNNSTYIKGNNSHFIFNPINRETVKRDNPDKGFKLTKGYRLPNVKNKRRQNDNLPLTDDEDSNNNSSIKLTKSPKIMRITKKNISGDFLELKLNKKILGVENTLQQMNSTSIKQKVKLDRIRSVPNFENP